MSISDYTYGKYSAWHTAGAQEQLWVCRCTQVPRSQVSWVSGRIPRVQGNMVPVVVLRFLSAVPPLPKEMQIPSDPFIGVKTQGSSGLLRHIKSNIFPPWEKVVPSEMCGVWVTLGGFWTDCGSFCSCWLECLDNCVLRWSQDVCVGPGPSAGPSVYWSMGLVMTSCIQVQAFFLPNPFDFTGR